MTVIAVRKTKKFIELAADGQTSWGGYKYPKADNSDKQVSAQGKIFHYNEITMGCAGSTSHIGLLRLFTKSHQPKDAEVDYVLEWWLEFREWMQKKAQVQPADISLCGIMVFKKRIFSFLAALEVEEIKDFDALGSGMFLAIGAMEVGADAKKAVKIACKYVQGCGGKVTNVFIEL